MANRVLLGERGGSYGLFVSAPGTDVVSGGNLLFDSTSGMVQIIASGVHSGLSGSSSLNIAVPSLGFSPFVHVFCANDFVTTSGDGGVNISFPSATLVRLTAAGGGNPSYNTGQIRYAIFNVPMF